MGFGALNDRVLIVVHRVKKALPNQVHVVRKPITDDSDPDQNTCGDSHVENVSRVGNNLPQTIMAQLFNLNRLEHPPHRKVRSDQLVNIGADATIHEANIFNYRTYIFQKLSKLRLLLMGLNAVQFVNGDDYLPC